MTNELSFIYKNFIEQSIPRSDRLNESDFVKFVGENRDRFDISFGNNYCLVECQLDPGYSSIVYMVVLPAYRNKGFGGNVVDKWLGRHPGQKVLIECSMINDAAVRFWESRGFHPILEYYSPPLYDDERSVMLLMANFDEDDPMRLLKMVYKYVYPAGVVEKE